MVGCHLCCGVAGCTRASYERKKAQRGSFQLESAALRRGGRADYFSSHFSLQFGMGLAFLSLWRRSDHQSRSGGHWDSVCRSSSAMPSFGNCRGTARILRHVMGLVEKRAWDTF